MYEYHSKRMWCGTIFKIFWLFYAKQWVYICYHVTDNHVFYGHPYKSFGNRARYKKKYVFRYRLESSQYNVLLESYGYISDSLSGLPLPAPGGSVTSVLFWLIVYNIWIMASFNSPPHPPGQNGHHFADDLFKCIFPNESCICFD